MRTLDEIVASARLNELLDPDEARYAIVAFDVLLAQLNLDQDAERLKEWMVAATNSPQEYVGEANDPQNPDAVAWYRAMHGVQVPAQDELPGRWDESDLSDGWADNSPARPSCYGRRLGSEACFHSCPVKEGCYDHGR